MSTLALSGEIIETFFPARGEPAAWGLRGYDEPIDSALELIGPHRKPTAHMEGSDEVD